MMARRRALVWRFALLAAAAVLPAAADTQFRVRRMARNDVPFGKGQCDIRLQVDGEVEVAVRGDMVAIRTISGRESRDDGSECNEPLPARDPQNFHFEVHDSRNDIRLVGEPSRRTGFAALVRIRDTSSGFGRYHFRLTWDLAGSGFPGGGRREGDFRPFDRPPSGMAWNNAMHFSAPGRGESTFQGHGGQRLSDATVDIDRGGRIQVSFRAEGGRPITFEGVVTSRERDTMKADVMTPDRRLRGPMYLSLDGRGELANISLEATNGQERLRLRWDRR
jgi:hypothetical protein